MTAHHHTTWAELKKLRGLGSPPILDVGGKAWLSDLRWRLLEALFGLVNHTPDYPIVPIELLNELQQHADELIWWVEYLKEQNAGPRPD